LLPGDTNDIGTATISSGKRDAAGTNTTSSSAGSGSAKRAKDLYEEIGLDIEVASAALAGHCRLSNQTFRCFRYYEMSSQRCKDRGDYLNSIHALLLCSLACLEFLGLVSNRRERAIEEELEFEVLLRFAKWQTQIARLYVKGGFPIELAAKSAQYGTAIIEAMVESLERTGTLSNELAYAGK